MIELTLMKIYEDYFLNEEISLRGRNKLVEETELFSDENDIEIDWSKMVRRKVSRIFRN